MGQNMGGCVFMRLAAVDNDASEAEKLRKDGSGL